MSAEVVPLLRVAEQQARVQAPPRWSRVELSGRLVELSGQGASAALTLAFGLVVDAQRHGEPVAWVNAVGGRSFFPPDAAAGGVDLDSLAVIIAPNPVTAAGSADKLLRSGAFGLVVLDLGRNPALPMGLQARLVKLAQKHDAAVLCLTEKRRNQASLSSLVSLRCLAERTPADKRSSRPGAGFACSVKTIKYKRRGPGWGFVEVCSGPPGLR